MSKLAVICDLDGTLCNLDHRLKYIKGKTKDWDKFFSLVREDTVIEPVAYLLDALLACVGSIWHAEILFVSGRPEKTRRDTLSWITTTAQLEFLDSVNNPKLYMRKDGDFRPDTIVKSEILDQIIAEGYEVLFAIDDRPSVIKMWEDRGIFVFRVKSHWDAEESVKPENRGKLTLMVGPSGAGKSKFLSNDYNRYAYDISDSEIISSDQVRRDLFGSFLDQSDNARVFRVVHALAKARIDLGLNATIDATNLRRSDRRAAIEATNPTSVRYILIDRPLENKLNTAGWRAGIPGLIERHHERFQSGLKEILSGDGIGAEIVDLRTK